MRAVCQAVELQHLLRHASSGEQLQHVNSVFYDTYGRMHGTPSSL
jgi:hypothetical protein